MTTQEHKSYAQKTPPVLSSSCGLSQPASWNAEGEAGAVAAAAFHRGGAAVELHDVLDDGKAKPRASLLAVAPLIDAIESLEDSVEVFFLNAVAVIDNLDFKHIVCGVGDDFDVLGFIVDSIF